MTFINRSFFFSVIFQIAVVAACREGGSVLMDRRNGKFARFLISRSNEALIHKGSPPTGWDFNEDIKVVSSHAGTSSTRYLLRKACRPLNIAWRNFFFFFFLFFNRDQRTPLILHNETRRLSLQIKTILALFHESLTISVLLKNLTII